MSLAPALLVTHRNEVANFIERLALLSFDRGKKSNRVTILHSDDLPGVIHRRPPPLSAPEALVARLRMPQRAEINDSMPAACLTFFVPPSDGSDATNRELIGRVKKTGKFDRSGTLLVTTEPSDLYRRGGECGQRRHTTQRPVPAGR